MGMVIKKYEVYRIDLDPTKVHEIQKTRPCLVISPNEMNHFISTVIIAFAAKIGTQYQLPLADSIIYATSRKFNCLLWTQDKQFNGLPSVRYFEK